jgi:hypothetical protein
MYQKRKKPEGFSRMKELTILRRARPSMSFPPKRESRKEVHLPGFPPEQEQAWTTAFAGTEPILPFD